MIDGAMQNHGAGSGAHGGKPRPPKMAGVGGDAAQHRTHCAKRHDGLEKAKQPHSLGITH